MCSAVATLLKGAWRLIRQCAHDDAGLRVDVGEPIAEATLLALADKLKQHSRPGRQPEAALGSRGSDPRLLGLTMGWLLDRTCGERPRASRIVQALGLDQPST